MTKGKTTILLICTAVLGVAIGVGATLYAGGMGNSNYGIYYWTNTSGGTTVTGTSFSSCVQMPNGHYECTYS